LLKGAKENSLRAASEQPFEVGFAHRKRKSAEIFAVHGEHVERAELHLIVMPAGM
jgi:hypothetical protein